MRNSRLSIQEQSVIKLVVKTPNDDDEFDTIATREYEAESFAIPEPKQLVSIPGEDNDDRYFVENIVHSLGEDTPELTLIVRDEEEVIREVRQQRAQMRKMKQMQQQAQQGGGGNPFSGGGGGGGNQGGQGGGGNPFSL
jgi:hypothetical protein